MSLMIFNASTVPTKTFKFCWDTKNNKALPLDLARLERLSVRSLAISTLIKVVIIQKTIYPNLATNILDMKVKQK
jgi:hypothetical protein